MGESSAMIFPLLLSFFLILIALFDPDWYWDFIYDWVRNKAYMLDRKYQRILYMLIGSLFFFLSLMEILS